MDSAWIIWLCVKASELTILLLQLLLLLVQKLIIFWRLGILFRVSGLLIQTADLKLLLDPIILIYHSQMHQEICDKLHLVKELKKPVLFE